MKLFEDRENESQRCQIYPRGWFDQQTLDAATPALARNMYVDQQSKKINKLRRTFAQNLPFQNILPCSKLAQSYLSLLTLLLSLLIYWHNELRVLQQLCAI